MKNLFRLLIFSLITSTIAHGQLAIYTFGNSSTAVTSAASVGTNLSAGSFTSGGVTTISAATSSNPSSSGASGVSGASGTAVLNGTGAGFKDGSGYFEVILTPDSGYELSITSIEFNSIATSTGSKTWDLQYSSNDSSFSSIFTGSNASATWTNQTSGSITLTGITQSITFRLFGDGASSASGSFRLDDVKIYGTVSAVPEPSTYATLAGVALLGFAGSRRRRGGNAALLAA